MRGELKPLIVPIPAAAAWEDWWFAWALTQVAPVDYLDAPVYRYRRHGRNFMLGVTEPEIVLDRVAEEIRFRRYMLGTVRPGTASPAELGPVAERVAGEDAPDMLALPASPVAWLSGLTQAECVLGLREHVERRRRFPLRA